MTGRCRIVLLAIAFPAVRWVAGAEKTCPLQSVQVLSPGQAVSSDWQVHRIHPFVEATADELPQHLGSTAVTISLTGLQNDWIHQAIAVASTGQNAATVTLSLQGPPEILRHVRLRVVGFIKQDGLGYVLDPIFDKPGALDLERHRQYMRNFQNIHAFPTVTATPQDPVVVWITADTRGVPAGRYAGSLRVKGPDRTAELPLELTVRAYALPEDNPLLVWGTHWLPSAPARADGARLLLEYGINVCHGDAAEQEMKNMEISHAAGFKFFLFVFAPSWKGAGPDETDLAAADRRIAEIKAFVEKLRLQPRRWAFYLIDEPTDRQVPEIVKWCAYIRKKWPEARFFFDLGWTGSFPHNAGNTVEGTIKPLLPYTSVWLAYSAWFTDDQSSVSIPLMRQHGEQVWFYECLDFKYGRRPSVGRDWYRTAAWTAARYKLQGIAWYSLNAYPSSPWESKGAEAGCIYDTIPARSLEALRQGIQEYKRIYALREMGVAEATIQGWIDRALGARSVRDIDAVRLEMDDEIVKRVGQ